MDQKALTRVQPAAHDHIRPDGKGGFGQGGGGARLTETGAEVLRLYREVLARAEAAAAEPIAELEAMLRRKAESELSGGK